MQVTVERISAPKPGKRNATAHAGGKAYSYNPAELMLSAGNTYDLEVKESILDSGVHIFFVQKATRIEGTTTSAHANGSSPAQSTDRWYMPFVSNTVAHAIAAGAIKDSSQIHVWAVAAKKAAVSLENPQEDYADDDRSYE